MREIKFRGKDAVTGKWVYGYYANRFGQEVIYHEAGYKLVIAGTVGQFTGLKDKNGKEIYEGDVVEWYDQYCDMKPRAVVCFGEHRPMVFDTIDWLPEAARATGFYALDCADSDGVYILGTSIKIEVVGNIHESGDTNA